MLLTWKREKFLYLQKNCTTEKRVTAHNSSSGIETNDQYQNEIDRNLTNNINNKTYINYLKKQYILRNIIYF